MGVLNPNLRGHTKAYDFITPSQGATQLCGFIGPYPQLKEAQKNCGFQVRGQNPGLEKVSPKPNFHQKKAQFIPKKNHEYLTKKTHQSHQSPPHTFFFKTLPK